MGVEPRGAPTDLPDFFEVRVVGVERRALLKRVCGEGGCERFECERLAGGLDVDVEIAPGAPPERLKAAMRAAIG